ncbi:DUF3291 domain-containing protein [Tahibacter amnicola]|uniref:DUF3291 domain-containing protein n=1 Tax=Tahibacter amnicola TaxID=2976241 RepID=A0ABY6BHQ9_9GAMM|nr:DUF3291 domain-containing protein [Tahibacter amnicola]UXI69136.1 DUF3291 domain-containing protein [Tahibacter amnicola]
MSAYELAQLNVARMKEPLESPSMADFVANIDRMNALAESSAGYVWRFVGDGGYASEVRPLGDDILINLSVWKDVESLARFAFKSDHVEILRRRGEWFDRMPEAYAVLWWVPEGHRPDLDEAKAKLDLLRTQGPTAEAFSFRTAFAPPGQPVKPSDVPDVA